MDVESGRQVSAVVCDTIAAVATSTGKGGIGVIRVSGPEAQNIAVQITATKLVPRYAHYLTFLGNDSQPLDQGVAILFSAPASFTGEDVLELQAHGGPIVLDLLLQRVLSLGARQARAGEFSERAFHNDKLDLAQAEAISDLIESTSEAAARAAMRTLRGEFSEHIGRINDELVALRVWLEAAMDFSEEDIDFLAEPQLRHRTKTLTEQFELLLSRAEQGQRLRDGLSVVIAGATNAGKSSLLNRLSGEDTAIVTDIAGTTRDVIRADINVNGIPLHIIDTAGVRATNDPVEQIGIERARNAAQESDHVLVILDATNPEVPTLPIGCESKKTIILNKIDLIDSALRASIQQTYQADVSVSAKSGEGLDALRDRLLSVAGVNTQVEGVYSAKRRHLASIQAAQLACKEAVTRLECNNMPELAAEELRIAHTALSSITGQFDSEDLLGEIFSSFCVGK